MTSGSRPRRWRDVLPRVYKGIAEERVMLIAAGVTFYATLALFPGIAAVVSIYGLVADPGGIATHVDALGGFAPGGVADVLRGQLTRLTQRGSSTLGLSLAVSLALSLWTAKSGVSGLFDALTAVYREEETRGLLQYYAVVMAFTVGAIALVLVALAMMIAIPLALAYIPQLTIFAVFLKWATLPVLFLVTASVLSVIYRFGPCRAAPRWRWITWGSVVATIGWLAVSAAFSWYVGNFGSYNKTYGSLGAIMGFMTWLWISIIVVLVGGMIDAERAEREPERPRANPG